MNSDDVHWEILLNKQFDTFCPALHLKKSSCSPQKKTIFMPSCAYSSFNQWYAAKINIKINHCQMPKYFKHYKISLIGSWGMLIKTSNSLMTVSVNVTLMPQMSTFDTENWWNVFSLTYLICFKSTWKKHCLCLKSSLNQGKTLTGFFW